MGFGLLRGLLLSFIVALPGLCGGVAPASAADCPGHPDALGTSRIIVVDPKEHVRIGTMSYAESLPLVDHEVVLTFDDGPLPPYTGRILDILASECIHATYFIVGSMAKAYPAELRRVYEAGHTIGTHSMTHPLKFRALGPEQARAQIEDGINATAAVLGDASRLAPFFRFPGFGHTAELDDYLASRGLMAWGADAPADDWKKISAEEIVRRAMRRLQARGKGILLLHDIHQRTVEALPMLIKELKENGFRIVHVVPSSEELPATVASADAWLPSPRIKARVLPAIAIDAVETLSGESLLNKSADALCSLKPVRKKKRDMDVADGKRESTSKRSAHHHRHHHHHRRTHVADVKGSAPPAAPETHSAQ
jgi:peptidoglycan/xylan/chitin deacetylase (PgdA/CDA1 family)